MTREEVIRGLECRIGGTKCGICPYNDDDTALWCGDYLLLKDALTLLKAQEPVEPILKRDGWNKYYNNYVCPVCDQELVYEQNYCSECGRAVKWDG